MRPARRARTRTRLRARVVRPGGRSAVAGPPRASRRGSPTGSERDASGGFDRKGCRWAYDRREPAQHRAQKRPGDRRAHGDADQLAATFLRRRGDQPREAAGPGEGAPYTLEAGEIQDPGALGETERDARGHDDREAGEDGRLDPGLTASRPLDSRRRTLQTRRQPTGRRAPTSRGRTRPRNTGVAGRERRRTSTRGGPSR